MARQLLLVPWPRAAHSFRRFSSPSGSPPSVDAVIGDFVNRKWKKKSPADLAAQVWPTDRALTDAVEPAPTLQGHWESLERRVTGRRPRRDGKRGRSNLRKVRTLFCFRLNESTQKSFGHGTISFDNGVSQIGGGGLLASERRLR